ncbi:phage holin family protein [Candidatus Microgenomates bacterium]|nr:phage holin family protein [Candidatus Microgenomates bacterium]
MKRILRHFTIDTVSLYLASSIASGLVFEKGIETIVFAGLGLTLASLIAKPIINVLMLPINLISFGLFRWVSSAIALYLVTLVVDGFQIVKFHFGGFSSVWFDLPNFTFEGVAAIISFSLLLSLIASFIYWLVK